MMCYGGRAHLCHSLVSAYTLCTPASVSSKQCCLEGDITVCAATVLRVYACVALV